MNSFTDWEEGDRVLAPWEQEWLYPGTIRCIDDDVAFIRFDDGDRGLLPLTALQAIHIRVGARVFVRPDEGPLQYSPARVVSTDGEDLCVRYEDGTEEDTTIGCVRIERGTSWYGGSLN